MLEMEMAKILSPMGGAPSSWAWPEWFAKLLRVMERIAAGTMVHQGGWCTYLHFLKQRCFSGRFRGKIPSTQSRQSKLGILHRLPLGPWCRNSSCCFPTAKREVWPALIGFALAA